MKKSTGALLVVLVLLASVFEMRSQNMFRKVNDFDGDGKSDYAVTRSEDGFMIWYVWQSTAGFKRFHWGKDGDGRAPGDYDGDGKTDFAVHRFSFNPNFGRFYILQSQTNTLVQRDFVASVFNVPMQQDYDGDGKIDPANFSLNGSSGSVTIFLSATNTYGSFSPPTSDFPIKIGDMDGDGHADHVTVLTGTPNQVTITNFVTQATRTVRFGTDSDLYVPADFDGDGIGEIVVFRTTDGNWWWIRSSDGAVRVANWGVGTDIPVPADYDGDGKTDLAIWRPGTAQSPQSYFWVKGSQNGVSVFAWGLQSDFAVTY